MRVYARTPHQDSIGQQLLGVADDIVVPDTFFVKATAFADEVPTNGGFTGLNFGAPTVGTQGFGGGAQSLNKSNLTQTESSQLFPYVLHRFGDTGTGKFGINLTQTYASSTSGSLLNSPNGPASRTETGEAIAQFLSGPQFGADHRSGDARRGSHNRQRGYRTVPTRAIAEQSDRLCGDPAGPGIRRVRGRGHQLSERGAADKNP